MDWRTHWRTVPAPSSPWASLPGGFEGLAFPFPCIPFLCCLGWRGFSWRGPWLAGIRLPWLRGLGCPGGLPYEIRPKTFLKKSLARCGMFVPINTQRRENRQAKQTNEKK